MSGVFFYFIIRLKRQEQEDPSTSTNLLPHNKYQNNQQSIHLLKQYWDGVEILCQHIRAERYSVQTWTGPRTGANRSSPRSMKFVNSVLVPVPVDRTGEPNKTWHGRADRHGVPVPRLPPQKTWWHGHPVPFCCKACE